MIEDRAHSSMSRGKLPHISRRASAMSSSVMCTFRSAHSPNRLRRGFFGPFFTVRKSTKSKTSFCSSGGKSRSFSRTSCSMVIDACRAASIHYTPSADSADWPRRVCGSSALNRRFRLSAPSRPSPLRPRQSGLTCLWLGDSVVVRFQTPNLARSRVVSAPIHAHFGFGSRALGP